MSSSPQEPHGGYPSTDYDEHQLSAPVAYAADPVLAGPDDAYADRSCHGQTAHENGLGVRQPIHIQPTCAKDA